MVSKEKLDAIYRRYNRRDCVHPDPLEFLYGYPKIHDREIVALVASTLAYGRVAQILKSVSVVLDALGPSPADFLAATSAETIRKTFSGFVHRFATGETLSALLVGIKRAAARYGSLHHCFLAGFDPADQTIMGAMNRFVDELLTGDGSCPGHLLPRPERGSACKRLNLFLRWVVRNDAVDPGGWDQIPTATLIVPLDVHMHRIGRLLGFTTRKQTDIRTALEITDGFRRLVPDDPVRYDFALTRFGIRENVDPATILFA